MPKRIQRKRTKGWRMGPNTVYVGRPGPWGNPYMVGTSIDYGELIITPELAVALYRAYALQYLSGRALEPLEGKNLCCWCALDQTCHGDVLLDLANTHEDVWKNREEEIFHLNSGLSFAVYTEKGILGDPDPVFAGVLVDILNERERLRVKKLDWQ